MAVKTKKMMEPAFAKVIKEITANAELIRTRQDEKQAVLNEFDKEKKRYKTGKISAQALRSSTIKTNKELGKIDDSIRSAIKKVGNLTIGARKFAVKQSPKTVTVKSGIVAKRKKAKKK